MKRTHYQNVYMLKVRRTEPKIPPFAIKTSLNGLFIHFPEKEIIKNCINFNLLKSDQEEKIENLLTD